MSAKKSLFVLGAFAGLLPSSSEGGFPLSVDAVRLLNKNKDSDPWWLKNAEYIYLQRDSNTQIWHPTNINDITSSAQQRALLLWKPKVASGNPDEKFPIRKAVVLEGGKGCEEASLESLDPALCREMFGGNQKYQWQNESIRKPWKFDTIGLGLFVKDTFKTATGKDGCYVRRKNDGFFSSGEIKVLFGPLGRICKDYKCGAVCKQDLSREDKSKLFSESKKFLEKKQQPVQRVIQDYNETEALNDRNRKNMWKDHGKTKVEREKKRNRRGN